MVSATEEKKEESVSTEDQMMGMAISIFGKLDTLLDIAASQVGDKLKFETQQEEVRVEQLKVELEKEKVSLDEAKVNLALKNVKLGVAKEKAKKGEYLY